MGLDQLLPILKRVQAQGSVPWSELKQLFGVGSPTYPGERIGAPGILPAQSRRGHSAPPRPATPPAQSPATVLFLSLIHISEPTRLRRISYAVFCLKKKKKKKKIKKNK